MRIAILGPAVNKLTSGGVAIFDEGLYFGFKELGHDVYLISANKSDRIETISFCKSGKPIDAYFKRRNIAKILKKIKPDLVITSLHYSLGIKCFKKYCPSAKYIQILHGFSCPINGRLKASLTNYLIRKVHKKFDYVVAVSYLTYAINKKINNILCNAIIPNGCNFTSVSKGGKSRKYDFVYVGRLFEDKEVKMICEAFVNAKRINNNLHFAVAGYGEMEYMFSNGQFKNGEIEFLGKLSQDDVGSLLQNSRFLVSLNSLEPFGIVFAEAIVNGCNVVTQSTSGFSFMFGKKDYFHTANVINSKELTQRLLDVSNNFVEIDQNEIEYLRRELSFASVAKKYLDLLKPEEEK